MVAALSAPATRKRIFSAALMTRRGQCDTVHLDFSYILGDDPARGLAQNLRVREEGRGMPVRAETEKNQVKAGIFDRRILTQRARGLKERFAQGRFIRARRVSRRLFGENAVDILRGRVDARQQHLVSHAVVAVGVIGRDRALIAPEKMDAGPIHLCGIFRRSEERVQIARR